jgi:hypothetical protein
VDTVGIGAAHQYNPEAMCRDLPEPDALIFVVSFDQPSSRSELDYLDDGPAAPEPHTIRRGRSTGHLVCRQCGAKA